jgi:hyperosmotically inducible periplasmic protein
MAMKSRAIALACVLFVAAAAAGPGDARTIGQAIDDAAIVASVKAKLTADQLSNLVKIDVGSNDGVVTLSGTVDTPERRDRIVQLTTWVNGVKQVVNNIQVRGGDAKPSTVTVPPASSPVPAGSARVDATGSVASVEPASGTLVLADGRVVRVTDGTVIWQATTVQSLRPGTQVLIRGGQQAGVEGRVASAPIGWRMGTIRTIDRASGQLVLTDGTVVRVTPSTIVQRGSERLTVDALQPGWEIVVRVPPAPSVDASQIDVVWAPTALTR